MDLGARGGGALRGTVGSAHAAIQESTPACARRATGAAGGYRRLPGDGWTHHPYSLYKRPDVASARADEVSISELGRLTLGVTQAAASASSPTAPSSRSASLASL